jgi:hypothetical protein
MATLRQISNQRKIPVPRSLLVGRGPACGLRVDERHVSTEHASLRWHDGHWEVRDLGSRNGTFVDGKRLAPGEVGVLAVGAEIGFGSAVAEFVFDSDVAPSVVAESLTDGVVAVAQGDLLPLPSEAQPDALVCISAQGRWVLEENEGEQRPLHDGDVVTVAGKPWRIHLPGDDEGTAALDLGPRLDAVTLRFEVSRDEEFVQITVVHRGKETTLEAREHGYLLLTLARARLDDQAEPLAEQGWVDRPRLLKMLGIEGNALNVGIYRARNQLAEAGIDNAASIVEVRRGQRRLGIEPERLEIKSMA